MELRVVDRKCVSLGQSKPDITITQLKYRGFMPFAPSQHKQNPGRQSTEAWSVPSSDTFIRQVLRQCGGLFSCLL